MKNTILPACLVIAFVIFLGFAPANPRISALRESGANTILQSNIKLPINWGDVGLLLVSAGVIDTSTLAAIYPSGLDRQTNEMLSTFYDKPVMMNGENAGELLNLLWAFGLANRNPILDSDSEMQNTVYGGAGNFASTGGWTISVGDAMAHYGAHSLVKLSDEEQKLVESTSAGIYRPCCGNSAHFPDCNHGMAMLGLLELMALNGADEKEMYKTALAVNSYWFPGEYAAIAEYLDTRGVAWSETDPREIVGKAYSSSSGYARIRESVVNRAVGTGRGCSV